MYFQKNSYKELTRQNIIIIVISNDTLLVKYSDTYLMYIIKHMRTVVIDLVEILKK